MNKNGYINASDLCKQGNKRLLKWNQTKHASDLEKEICVVNPIRFSDLKHTVKGGTITIIRGTYVHSVSVANKFVNVNTY
jgi:hypothetical protein